MRFKGRGLKTWTNQICSLNAPWAAVDAAVDAALAAAVWTVLLDMTPVANSCWAFSKLAPVVRYRAWIWGRGRSGSQKALDWFNSLWICVYLLKHDERHDGQGGEESGHQDHDDAHRDALVQPSQCRDPAAEETSLQLKTYLICPNWSKRGTKSHIDHVQVCGSVRPLPVSFWRCKKLFSWTNSLSLPFLWELKKVAVKNAHCANNANILKF